MRYLAAPKLAYMNVKAKLEKEIKNAQKLHVIRKLNEKLASLTSTDLYMFAFCASYYAEYSSYR